MGFRLFSVQADAFGPKGRGGIFPLLKCAACAAILLALLSGCARTAPLGKASGLSGDAPSARHEADEADGKFGGDQMTILCYGDSNTYGYDPCSAFGGRYPADARWVDILSEKTGAKTVNGGENGREIPRRDVEFKRFQDLLTESRADCLIVMLGGNDLLQGASPETAAERMENFLSQITGIEKSGIILVGLPSMELGAWVPDESLIRNTEELCAAYEKLAEKLGIRYVDAGAWDIELCYDGVHFTEKGHEAFAEEMAEYLRD